MRLEKIALTLMGTAVAVAVASPANAISITTGGTAAGANGVKTNVFGATTIDFNSGSAPTSGFATYTPGGTTNIVTGSVASQYAAPTGDTTPYLTIAPVANNVTGNTGSVTINFAKALDYFGLYWGSVDTYNSISFYDGANLLTTFTGSNIPDTTASGNQTSPQDNVFVNFFAGAGEKFDKIVLTSTGVAFESDNHAYRAVPEPASILGLLLFGGLGVSSLVKNKSKLA
ncbi:PEP-CTERM putative exosortase interaction domain protein [Richelia sinica FACHB-800]|uniref:PEP-CTERM putative exosortase interaction domain protein n=1 Tax=Richelia sinica FACHB-800 TaxID=1357546 RepID=A0A975TD53_9NOST|nr:PEP-CTERM sorting domain-containing protein [Richelia sinica]MBD2667505.1 PEP-CTERM sorting domain-containing protein [Richelia sinica FACHB-800]QXE26497.1 PEP-CTERM putative exosortase interaction domain protein [Richelia sinica FACHB-800]